MKQAAPLTPSVGGLTIYPLKSAAGVAVAELALDDRGAVGDRRWLLVDPSGHAITARETHALLHVRPRFASDDRNGSLMLDASDHPTCVVPVPDASSAQRQVVIWKDTVTANDAGDDAAAWCSDVIGRACRLVRVADEATRPLKTKYAGPLSSEGRRVAFTDGAPLMLLGHSSIAALNARLALQGHPESMDHRRFRANVWLDTTGPHEEDTWRRVRIGSVELGLGSLCVRCVLTTVNPDTLAAGAEPLRSFSEYRRVAGGVAFGVNATHAAPGTMRVGDMVDVIEAR